LKTKYLIKFLNRAAQFDADLELTDIFSKASKYGHLTNGDRLFECIDEKKHIRLAARKVCSHNRKLAVNHL
jgi:hypothetical protein